MYPLSVLLLFAVKDCVFILCEHLLLNRHCLFPQLDLFRLLPCLRQRLVDD